MFRRFKYQLTTELKVISIKLLFALGTVYRSITVLFMVPKDASCGSVVSS